MLQCLTLYFWTAGSHPGKVRRHSFRSKDFLCSHIVWEKSQTRKCLIPLTKKDPDWRIKPGVTHILWDENSASEVMLSPSLGPRYDWYCLDMVIITQMHPAAGGGHVCLSWVEPSLSGCWASEKLNGRELNCLQTKAANRESTAQLRVDGD